MKRLSATVVLLLSALGVFGQSTVTVTTPPIVGTACYTPAQIILYVNGFNILGVFQCSVTTPNVIVQTSGGNTSNAATANQLASNGSANQLWGMNAAGSAQGWQNSGGMVYPGAGVPYSTGTSWGSSYAVGTGANDLVQLNASAQLPGVSGVNLTGMTLAQIAAGAAGTGIYDFSAATNFKLPVAAGYAGTASGECGHDSTNHNFHCYDNAVDNFVALFPSATPPTSGHMAGFLSTGGAWTLEDLGAPVVSGFPITLGSTSIASGSTTTSIAGLTLVTPALGTPASGVITNLTGTCASCVANSAATATNIASNGSANQLWGMNAGGSAQGWQNAGGMVYPGAGVPDSTGSAWGSSYAVGTSANNLVQLNASAQLPGVSGVNLTGMTLAQIAAGAAGTGIYDFSAATNFKLPIVAGYTAAMTNVELGASGTLGTAVIGNATSGTVTLEPVTGALGTVTASLPANTGTLAETNLAQTWTAAQTISGSSGTLQDITTSATGTTYTLLTMLSPNLGSGNTVGWLLGENTSTANDGINFNFTGNTTPSNNVWTMGFYGGALNLTGYTSGGVAFGNIPSNPGSNNIMVDGFVKAGNSGTSAGGVVFSNATSGTVTLESVTGALGTVTASLPANTGTLAETNINNSFSTAQSATAFISTGTKFTASGCTSITSTSGGATAGVFTIGAGACTVVITMNGATGLTAPHGYSCHANDETTAAGNTGLYFSANSTTTATLTVPTTASASDVIDFGCDPY